MEHNDRGRALEEALSGEWFWDLPNVDFTKAVMNRVIKKAKPSYRWLWVIAGWCLYGALWSVLLLPLIFRGLSPRLSAWAQLIVNLVEAVLVVAGTLLSLASRMQVSPLGMALVFASAAAVFAGAAYITKEGAY